jgi:hypothetical protein
MIDRVSRDDFERIRLRQAALALPEDNLVGGGVPAFVGQVTTASTLIGVGNFLMVQPIFVMGQEVEGGAGQLSTVGSSRVPVYLIGPGLPATGDSLICKFVDNRWVAERSGGAGSTGNTGVIPNCFCSPIPANLTMTSADPTCNFGMFQGCSITYGPTPPEYDDLDLGTNTFLSTESFPDELADGALFRYFLTCTSDQFNLSRVYLDSPYGSPYRDGVLYTWLVGSDGNTCEPFHLDSGQAFPGSDESCSVTIDG